MSAATPNRWRIPVGAVLVHICIGSVYAWSTFNRPIQQLLPGQPWWFSPPYTTFTTALALLGLSAAFGGPWVERRGPRVAATAAAVFFGAGLLIGGTGLAVAQPVLVFLGMGVISGIGCGLGYISPVSTLVKWFPDRRGMATGMAIMGFGGGAFIAGYLNVFLMNAVGVAATVIVLGAVYLAVMMLGSRLLQPPPAGWAPEGWVPPAATSAMIATTSVTRDEAIRTPQFFLLWGMLCINVTAGIGILERAAPIWTDFFGAGAAVAAVTAAAAGYVALLSLANMLGRIGWSTTSDYLGRKNMYRGYLGVGALLYLTITLTTNSNPVIFLICSMLILSFYGGGFATVPAYLRDLFGTYQVGAIHGRLLTAWSVAGVLGPLIVNAIADAQIAAKVSGPARYTTSFTIMIGLLVIGFICNELIKPVADKFHEARSTATTGAQA